MLEVTESNNLSTTTALRKLKFRALDSSTNMDNKLGKLQIRLIQLLPHLNGSHLLHQAQPVAPSKSPITVVIIGSLS